MATHIQSHTGFGIELGSLIGRIASSIGQGLAKAFSAIKASREAQVLAEIERYDHRLADEIRAAALRDLTKQ